MAKELRRRRLMQGLVAGGLGAAAAWDHAASRDASASTDRARHPAPKFLIVLCATGGASIIDGPLAIRASESDAAATLNTFPDAAVTLIANSPFRAVDLSFDSLANISYPFATDQSSFVAKHKDVMQVVSLTSTSVNHAIAQRRAVTGNDAWKGRTLQEAVADAYGGGSVLPNVHLLTGTGFTDRGSDGSLDPSCYGELVADATTWPIALSGVRGTRYPVAADTLDRARALRNESLEAASPFVRAFGGSPKLQRYLTARNVTQPALEEADLITKLMLFGDSAALPLETHGLASSPDAELVMGVFPELLADPLQARAALAFLLLKHGVTVTVTLGPTMDLTIDGDAQLSGAGLPPGSLINPPLAFDFAHTGHRSTQAMMWHRIYRTIDGLISLLSGQPYGEQGDSMWDHTLIYVATDFGRSKIRPADAAEFASGHDLNNGVLLVSPLLSGNRVLGGIDPHTGMSHGFNLASGAADPGRETTERELYAGVLAALGVDLSDAGLPDMSAMRS